MVRPLSLLAAAATVGVSTAVPPPGALFDLSSFSLQLPLSDGSGGVQTIDSAALKTYTGEYFYTNATTRAMTFWCPEDGAHTPDAKFPRSELRQEPNWFMKGFNQLNVTLSVLQLPSTGSITIGQVHASGGLSGDCSIIIELEYSSGDVLAHLRDKACKGVIKTVGRGYALGDTLSYTLTMDGTTASVSTDSGSMPPYDYTWPIGGIPVDKTPVYFKLGDYVQASSSSSKVGGTVAVSAFNMVLA